MIFLWIGFILFVLAMLALDLGVFHRHAHVVKIREALIWSGVWIALSLCFNVLIYYIYAHPQVFHLSNPEGLTGGQAAVKFFTGYVIEKSLSVDNIFVIAMVFAYFRVPDIYQHRVLFWGILGALVMRGVMIGLGAVLISRFEWLLYIFGAFLIFTAYKMLSGSGEPHPEQNPLVKMAQKFFPVTHEFHAQHFIVRADAVAPHESVTPPEHNPDSPANPIGKTANSWVLTPLALALIVVETTDLIFAVDSIPAIFAITTDPFLVFTSNICAILGLRALYFALAGILDKFKYLKVSLAAVLGLVGLKMLLKEPLHTVPGLSFYTLGAIALILGAGILASIIAARREPQRPEHPPAA